MRDVEATGGLVLEWRYGITKSEMSYIGGSHGNEKIENKPMEVGHFNLYNYATYRY
jgi:hypothetical protein